MKISFDCECILLQNSLELFLKDFLAHKKDCDFIISDRKIQSTKPVFIIAKDSPYLKIPFSKEMLLNTIEEFYSAIQLSNSNLKTSQNAKDTSVEEAVANLVDKFKLDLINLLKSHL